MSGLSADPQPHHLFYVKWLADLPPYSVVGEVGPHAKEGAIRFLEALKKMGRKDVTFRLIGSIPYAEKMTFFGRAICIHPQARDLIFIDDHDSPWQSVTSFRDYFFDVLVVTRTNLPPEETGPILRLWSRKVKLGGTFVYYVNSDRLPEYILPSEIDQKRVMLA